MTKIYIASKSGLKVHVFKTIGGFANQKDFTMQKWDPNFSEGTRGRVEDLWIKCFLKRKFKGILE